LHSFGYLISDIEKLSGLQFVLLLHTGTAVTTCVLLELEVFFLR
jgi:hypothetical protein